jgi:hypothetical protein
MIFKKNAKYILTIKVGNKQENIVATFDKAETEVTVTFIREQPVMSYRKVRGSYLRTEFDKILNTQAPIYELNIQPKVTNTISIPLPLILNFKEL